MLLGVHVSIAGSIDLAINRAQELKCNTMQIFTRNPRGWKFEAIKKDNIQKFREKIKEFSIISPVIHMPYLPNLSSPEDNVYNISVETLIAELRRSGELGIPYVVTHLGSHKGTGIESGIKRVANACNKALSKTNNECMIVLENTSGSKNSVGSKFEEIKEIIEKIDNKERIGVCLDTCHAFAAGYDMTENNLNTALKEYDSVIGMEKIKVIHLNDSKGERDGRLDRHEHIGMGKIGEGGFKNLLSIKKLSKLPFILETPIDERRDDRGNIEKILSLSGI